MRPNDIETVIPSCKATWNLASLSWDRPGPNRFQQKTVTTTIGKALLHDTTIDLSAFFVQYRTFFPSELITQSPGIVECGPTAADWNNAASVQVYDIITSVPINQQQLCDAIVDGDYPGFPDFPLDNQYIMYGCLKVYGSNSTTSFPGYMQLLQSSNFGGGLPTAAEKLYCYRIVIPNSNAPIANGASLNIPAVRYQFKGVTEDEDELTHIYRLRQSYEQREQA